MNQPKVSVVICTYNQEALVRDTIDSVLAQTYPNLEIIVTDDGSTDGTPGILQRYAQQYPDRIKIGLSPINTGIPANINRGLALRTGEYTAWLDGDDVMLPQKIEKQVALLENHPEATGCYHDAEVFDAETGQTLGKVSVVYNGSPKLKQGRLGDWLRPRYYSLPSTIMARTVACPAHGYDERLKHLSEVVFFVEVFRTGILLAFDDVLVRYRRHAHNITSDPVALAKMVEYELMVYAILQARYPDVYPVIRRSRISCLLAAAVKCYREGDRARGDQIIRNLMHDGVVIKSLIVAIAMRLFKQQATQMTSGQPFNRPNWVKRLARRFVDF